MGDNQGMSLSPAETKMHDIDFVTSHAVKFLHLPEAWKTKLHFAHNWKVEKFPPEQRNSIPKDPGVYVFVVDSEMFGALPTGGIFYVGKATKLYDRIGKYISEIGKGPTTRPKIWKMINKWNGCLKYYYQTTTTVDEAELLEDEMLSALRPPFNTQYNAQISEIMRAF